MTTRKTGIALGGGGARGFAHLGVLQALKEKGIQGDMFCGTSAGSVVGAFMAAGEEPLKVFDIMKKHSFFDFAKMTLPSMGLFNLDNLAAHLEKHLRFKKIEELPKPLIVTVADMCAGKVKYLETGPLAKAVQASSSIPVLFSPVAMDGTLYSDGGVFDNLPYRPLEASCDFIYAIHISPIRPV
ncbi:MAG: patatin-like phospholipase family protein, partial [Bacteroidota bacterium]|nr:patatin-like phospholipase family protein [Bacteroidota bacterium]MDX5430181.1 patatin-like phospholipase family protein [Bacteroidota bacterium]MDX5468944.1 patatin-like phospholipase family protein [Bacteroidota bacterium]